MPHYWKSMQARRWWPTVNTCVLQRYAEIQGAVTPYDVQTETSQPPRMFEDAEYLGSGVFHHAERMR